MNGVFWDTMAVIGLLAIIGLCLAHRADIG